MSNDRNITGINIDNIVGIAGGPAKSPIWDKDGNSGVRELSVAVSFGYKDKQSGEWKDTGTAWLNVSAAGDYASQFDGIDKGDKVRIDGGSLELREYKRKDESTGQAFDVRYATVKVVSKKGATAGQVVPDAGGEVW